MSPDHKRAWVETSNVAGQSPGTTGRSVHTHGIRKDVVRPYYFAAYFTVLFNYGIGSIRSYPNQLPSLLDVSAFDVRLSDAQAER